MCCFSCDENETCDEVCDLNHEDCGNALNEENALAEFKQGQLTVLKQIADIVTQKKSLE
jgi:hypothetical protein